MKFALVFWGCFLWATGLLAQYNCFRDLRSEGLTLLKQKDFRGAIDRFIAARFCIDKPASDDLDELIKQTQTQWVKELNQAIEDARSAEATTRKLANQADTLRFYLQGDSTYAVYFRQGKIKFRNGNYREALYDFAIARFTNDTKAIKIWLQNTQNAIQSEQLAFNGDLERAFTLFQQLPSVDTADHRARRLKELLATRQKWLESIQEADLNSFDTLYLIYDLYFLPAELSQCTQLKTLFLSENTLHELPPESWMILQRVPHLEMLDLSNNQLWRLAPESWKVLSQLAALRTLILTDNLLQQLPTPSWAQLTQFTKLETLDLSRNQLTKIPAEVGQLKHLKKLILIENKLSPDPVDWQFLQHLRHLQVLDVRLNHFLPETIAYLSTLLPKDCLIFVD